MSQCKTVTMIKTQKGSPDGITVRPYIQGKTYNIPADLAKSFVTDLRCATYTDIKLNKKNR